MDTETLKILVVDDDPKFLEVMKYNLKNKNCQVECVFDQKTALSALINKSFHACFIDCILSSGQGVELIQDIKNILGDSVQIIMMSGVVPGKSLSKYIDVGICDFLAKPISDKDIENSLKQIREKYIHGNQKNILLKLFSQNYSNIQMLKFLISLKKAKDYEFFLYLSYILSSKESIKLNFEFNNKKHRIICQQGVITNYEGGSSDIFLNRLLSQNLITHQEADSIRGHSQEECIKTLLNKCMLSSGQIADIEHDMLIETLKEIAPGMEISMNIDLFTPNKKIHFLNLSQSEYADIVFLFLKQKFNNQLIDLFDEDIMKKHLVFEKNILKYSPEVEDFIQDIKSGIRLKGIYNKYLNDKNLFCFYVLYILLKGNAYLPKSNARVKYYYLYERYNKLYSFISKFQKPEKLFLYFTTTADKASLNIKEIKTAYKNFVRYNHPDSILYDLPTDLLDLIGKVLTKLQKLYNKAQDPSSLAEEEKKEQIATEILIAEKKKICERELEEQRYKKALSLIQSIPQRVLDEETDWQLLYLWLYFKNTDSDLPLALDQVHKYMKIIQSKKRDLMKNKMFQYVLGLYHLNKRNYIFAKNYLNKAKVLDPSFQPCYPEIRKCSFLLLKRKKEQEGFLTKLKSFSLKDFKKNLLKQVNKGNQDEAS